MPANFRTGWTMHPTHRMCTILQLALAVSMGAAVLLFGGSANGAEIRPVRFVMPNGLTVLVVEQHALPIIQVQALVKVGSAQDPSNKAGLANLVASLLDEGTTTRTAKQIAEQIEFVGGSLIVRASEDYTMAAARVLKKDAALGFDLLADILLHPSFPERELQRVRTHILGLILSEKDDPGQVAAKAF